MADISWSGCAGSTRYGRRCAGTCQNGKVGSPSIQCSGGVWPVESMMGKCVTGPGKDTLSEEEGERCQDGCGSLS